MPAAGDSIATRFMSDRSFFDTNVLVYTDDKATPAKQRRALEVVAAHRRTKTGVVSLQVLQEYFVAVTRKLHVDAAVARRNVGLIGEFDVFSLELGNVASASRNQLLGRSGRALCHESRLQRSAEDFQRGREIEGIKITNPFL
jgi:predicted nucleic acid-binding protein